LLLPAAAAARESLRNKSANGTNRRFFAMC
jgi:hypothetical protein